MILGRRQLHDEKSRGYEYPHQIVYPRSVRHTFNAPNVDQFYTNGCVGFAGTNLLNCAAAVRSRRVFNRPSEKGSHYLENADGLHNYAGSTKNDPFEGAYPPDDNGSSALGLMKFWKRYGIIESYEWCFTFNQFLAALQHQPVLVGTNWYEGMTYPTDNGRSEAYGEIVGGHEYLATGMSYSQQVIRCENSWGEGWGYYGGAFFVSFHDFEALLADGGDACVPRLL